jgi:tetratricopeptide (TPR) repeat protein
MNRHTLLIACTVALCCLFAAGVRGDEPASKLTPAAIAQRLADLAGPGHELNDREKALLADAADGRLARVSFAEAALLASGVGDPARQQTYLQRIASLEQDARRAVADAKAPFEKGKLLLTWMHSGPCRKYDANQDHLPDLLDDGRFNCVSVTTLYAILGKRLGLDVRGVVATMHMYAVLYDGAVAKQPVEKGDKVLSPFSTGSKDVETTNARGFDPKRRPPARRREVNDFGILAAVYRNQATRLGRARRHTEVVRAAALAQALDPRPDAPTGDLEIAFHNWYVSLAKKDQFAEARAVLRLGLELMPGNRKLIGDRRNGYAVEAQAHRKEGAWDKAVELLTKAVAEHPDEPNLRLDAATQYLLWAQHLEQQGDVAQAAAVLKRGVDVLPKSAGLRTALERVKNKQ